MDSGDRYEGNNSAIHYVFLRFLTYFKLLYFVSLIAFLSHIEYEAPHCVFFSTFSAAFCYSSIFNLFDICGSHVGINITTFRGVMPYILVDKYPTISRNLMLPSSE